jgi:hypothetical protein
VGLLRLLPGVTVLDDQAVEIEGVRFFGTTLWSDFEGRKSDCLDRVRRCLGEYVFVKTRVAAGAAGEPLRRFRAEDALKAHDRARAALFSEVAGARVGKTVVISHHAPSLQGLNPHHRGNGLDGAYASQFDKAIVGLDEYCLLDAWPHAHPGCLSHWARQRPDECVWVPGKGSLGCGVFSGGTL